MKKLTMAALIVLVCGTGVFLQRWLNSREVAVTSATNEVLAIRSAILAYREEYERPLDPGCDVIRVLRGDNPRQILFLSHLDPNHWPENRALDPWGRPYHFDLSSPENPRVQSLGPDGRQSPDDINSP